MAELYLFSQDDEFLTILSEDEGLVDTWFKDYENHVEDESFVFNVESNSPLLEHIIEENQAAFYDRDGRLRLVRMKGLREVTTSDGGMISHQIRVICEPSFLELHDHFIEDRRITDGTAQTALNRALDGSRYVGEVTVDLGLATDNFYWIDGIEAVFKILKTWGGALKDTITLNEDNEIIERKLWIVQRLGTDNGLIVEPDYNAEEISRNTLSYPETALWGQGASLEIEDDEGEHTGGYTRYLTFENVEWEVSNGDPVDKPKGQKWIGDPDALARDGYLNNGVRKHRFGHFSNQDYEDPEELLWATWQELQERKLKEVMHEATIYETDKKVSLGDTVTILDRNYNKPIELQSQITGLEYDVFYPDDEIKIVVGKYIDMNEDPLQKEVDDLKEDIRKPRPTKPIDNGSFPDIKPGTPVNVEAHGSFQQIHLFWDYDSKVYISHYEVYGSQISDFVPDEQHLLYRGRVSAFIHEVATDEKWYYYVRAVNTRGTEGEFSNRVDASSVRVINDDILFGEITADKLAENLDLANKLSEGTLDWINEEPLYEIRQSENRILNDVGNRIGNILNDIDLIEDDLGELRYQDVEINNRIDGLSTTVQNTTGALDDLTGEVEHQSTQISKWEQRADGFEQSVVDVRGDLNNAVSDISLIEQEANKISLSVSELETDFNNLEIGGSNLLLDTALTHEGLGAWTHLPHIRKDDDYLYVEQAYAWGVRQVVPLLKAGTYTISVLAKEGTNPSSRVRFSMVDSGAPNGGTVVEPLTEEWKKISLTFTIDEDVRDFGIYFLNGDSAGNALIKMTHFQLEKGNKAADWSPAPEDMADRANLISYINLSTEGVIIHGKKIAIDGETFISDGVIGTAAIANLAVDRFHLKQGIIDNVHIADATIEHGKIKSVNADKITVGDLKGIDIYGAKFRSSAGTDYMEIVGGEIDLRLNNGRYMYLSPTGLYGYNSGGSVRFQADSLLVTSAALGTSNRNVYLAVESGKEARVVDINDVPSDGEIGSYTYRNLRARGLYTNFVEANSAISSNHVYIRPRSGGEVRVTGASTTDAYYPLRVGELFSNTLITTSESMWLGTDSALHVVNKGYAENSSGSPIYRNIYTNDVFNRAMITSTTNAYIGTDNELRVVNKGLSDIYRDVRGLGFIGNRVGLGTHISGGVHFHVQPAGEVRITHRNGDGTYRPIRAREFNTDTSLRENKKNVEVYQKNVLDVFRNANAYLYNRRADEEHDQKQLGMMLHEMPFVTYNESNDSFALYALTTYVAKGVKDLVSRTDDHEDRINILELENQYLKKKIKQLEDVA